MKRHDLLSVTRLHLDHVMGADAEAIGVQVQGKGGQA